MWLPVLCTLIAVGADTSPIKKDETVVFFPTCAHLDEATGKWVAPIHGWIYEPSKLGGLALWTFGKSLGIRSSGDQTELFKSRARAFVVDNESDKAISIRLGDEVFKLPESAANGHFHGRLTLAAKLVETLIVGKRDAPRKGEKRDGELGEPARQRVVRFHAVMREGDKRRFGGTLWFPGATGLSVVSDIDDTVKISEVASKRKLLANQFLRPYKPVPGMAAVFRDWRTKHPGAAFHYVSASPWQLYRPMAKFLRDEKYPAGTFHMKVFRPKDSSFIDLFTKQTEYKIGQIRPLLEGYPRRRFVLVGDSGEQDPEIYGQLARKFPAQVQGILIRKVGGVGDTSERFEAAFKDVPKRRWRTFEDGDSLEDVEFPQLR